MKQAGEREWVRQARAGDRAAFAALVDLYWDRIRRWVFALTRQAELAEDLTQEVFVKAWVGLPELRADGHFRAWLFRIARNFAFDSRKGPRGDPCRPLPDQAPGREPEPLAVVVEQEAERVLQAACDRLPAAFRAAYLLWTQEELPYSEIARILAVSEATARWRVCKARQVLLQAMEAYLEPPKS